MQVFMRLPYSCDKHQKPSPPPKTQGLLYKLGWVVGIHTVSSKWPNQPTAHKISQCYNAPWAVSLMSNAFDKYKNTANAVT